MLAHGPHTQRQFAILIEGIIIGRKIHVVCVYKVMEIIENCISSQLVLT